MPGIVCSSRAKQLLGLFTMHTVAVMRRMRNSVARLGTRYQLFFGSDPRSLGCNSDGDTRAPDDGILLGPLVQVSWGQVLFLNALNEKISSRLDRRCEGVRTGPAQIPKRRARAVSSGRCPLRPAPSR